MAETIATLGVRVTGTGIKETERGLKDLTAQGAKAESQGERLGTAWGKNLGRAILAGTALATTGIALVIKNTIEAERVQAQLAARIKSTGGAAGLAVPELNRMSEALAKATTFDDEAIGEAQALLLTFTRIGKDVFPQATTAVLDMSTAMGTDLKSAALQVGKALKDPVLGVTALARAGVQFSASQKQTIKDLVETGRVAEAQGIVLAELETQMGGAARAARDTLGGALQALKNAFGDVLEGDTGGEGVKGTTKAINDLVDTLNDESTRQGFQAVVQGLASVTKFAAETIAMLGGVGSAVNQLFKSVGDKSFQGLVDTQIALENDLAALAEGGASAATRGALVPGTYIDVLESKEQNAVRIRGLLGEVIKLQDQFTQQQQGVGLGAERGGSSGSPNGRGRGVQGAAKDAAFSERVQETIDALNEEAAAFGLSKSALLERERAQDVANATTQQEKDALNASYDALIGKVRADEQASAAAKGAGKASRDAAEAERERQRVIDDGKTALGDLNQLVRQQAADLGGPAAQAAKAYADTLLDLIAKEDALRTANLLSADAMDTLTLARAMADEGWQRTIKAINEEKTAVEELIEDLEFEKSLRGLNNLQMQQEIALRHAGADATDDQRAKIRELIAAQEESARVAEGMDVLRQATQDAFKGLIDGSKSAKDVFEDFVESVLAGIAEIAARNLTEALFGSFGSSNTGSSGGWFASLISQFLGGGAGGGGGNGKAVIPGGKSMSMSMSSAIPPSKGLAVAAAPVSLSVHVTNVPGAKATATQTTGPDGSRQIKLMIDGAVAESLDHGKGAKVLQHKYGLNPQGVARG